MRGNMFFPPDQKAGEAGLFSLQPQVACNGWRDESRLKFWGDMAEMEHMFDKAVTPSDVGKLNRLVIPKQHAEKYFPLGSSSSTSSNEKGLLLNFEERSGRIWRFRYSYWNSSQSYVMTKGWSRFVKEKKLYAGDLVSFYRSVCRERFYIDWTRRYGNTNSAFPSSLFSFPEQRHLIGYPYPLLASRTAPGDSFPREHWNVTSDQDRTTVIESIPIVRGKTVVNRLRLFGVNICQSSPLHPDCIESSQEHEMGMPEDYCYSIEGVCSQLSDPDNSAGMVDGAFDKGKQMMEL